MQKNIDYAKVFLKKNNIKYCVMKTNKFICFQLLKRKNFRKLKNNYVMFFNYNTNKINIIVKYLIKNKFTHVIVCNKRQLHNFLTKIL